MNRKASRKGNSNMLDESALFKTLGKIGGIGGISLGVFLILFRDLIRKVAFPTLDNTQAYNVILIILLLTFGISLVGLVIWAVKSSGGGRLIALLLLLFGLALVVLATRLIKSEKTQNTPGYIITSVQDTVDFNNWQPFSATETKPISVVTRTFDLTIKRIQNEATFNRIASTSSKLGLTCE